MFILAAAVKVLANFSGAVVAIERVATQFDLDAGVRSPAFFGEATGTMRP